MPGLNGLGPRWQGPMTGGGRGFCAAKINDIGMVNNIRFYGRGQRRGWRHVYNETGLPDWMRQQRAMQPFHMSANKMTKDEEVSYLKNQADYLKTEIALIEARINNLENK